jgi:cytochrome P450
MMPHWALNHTHYEDPDSFNPDRYLQHPGLATEYASSTDYEKRDHYTYGAGRRICAGIHLAERTQWRIVASLLWAFNIEPARDERTRKTVEIDVEAYEEKLIAGPKPFPVRFTPRSQGHIHLIRQEFREAADLLKAWE